MPVGNTTPRGGLQMRGRRNHQKTATLTDQDEELTDLQRRFNALEDETRMASDKTAARAWRVGSPARP